MDTREPVPALEATIKLGTGISIDAYMLVDGRVRYGLEYVSLLMGHSRNYYRRLLGLGGTKKEPKFLKALSVEGFTGYQVFVKVSREGKRGASVAGTINFDDFCLLLDAEARRQNPKALALFSTSFRELLRSRTNDAFGIEDESLEVKQAQFKLGYEAYLEREEALIEARQEIEALSLPGDELYYPQHEDWGTEENDDYWYYWKTA